MADPSYQTLHQSQVALDPKYQAFHQSKVVGPKLSGCLPVRSSWTQVIMLFTSQTWRTQVIRLFTSHKWLWTENIRLFTSQKWLDPSYQAAYLGPSYQDFQVAGPKLSGCLPVRSSWTQVIRAAYQLEVAGPKLSGCLPVRSSWTQVIRIFTSQKWLDPSYQAAYQLEVAGPKLSGFSPVKSGRTQVIRLLTI